LGERLNGIQEVRGSTPLGSTIFAIYFKELSVAETSERFAEKVIKAYKE
jgi:hypothetical protein